MSSFWLTLKQQWIIEEISIFSNSSHLEWKAGLLDTILKGTHPGTIPARFGLIWFSGFREDLNVIFYQNMPNLHNCYKSTERNISQKNADGRQVMAKAHMALARWAKNGFIFINLVIFASPRFLETVRSQYINKYFTSTQKKSSWTVNCDIMHQSL